MLHCERKVSTYDACAHFMELEKLKDEFAILRAR